MADTTPATGPERFLVVGTVRKPHGIRGELSVAVETDQAGAVFRAGRVLTLGDARGRPTEEVLTVERARPFKDGMLLKVREYTSRTPALDALRGRSLLIPESEAAPLAEDEVFYHQLVGLRVLANGAEVGKVKEVLELPAGEMLVVRRPGADELLLPFVQSLIRRVDLAEGVLEVEPLPGLLEL
jgi:16S rRNA processing protein RimM